MIAFFLLGHAAVRVFELWPRGGHGITGDEPAQALHPAATVWQGTLAWEPDVRVHARLAPWQAGELETFRSAALRSRYSLAAGEAWRLVLEVEGERGLEPGSVVLRSEDGRALEPLAALVADRSGDPVLALLAGELSILPGESRPLLLWGERPAPRPLTLVIEADGKSAEGRLEPVQVDGPLERWFASADAVHPEMLAGASAAPGTDELDRLRSELVAERNRRAKRELEWFEYNRALASLAVPGLEGFPIDPALAPALAGAEPPEEAPAQDPEVERKSARAHELARSLSALMKIEGLRGLDLLDPGTLVEGGIGPVIFRTLDERGLLTGSLTAERLRLEASRAARAVTLVLERGFESHGGERIPFASGERRILMAETDPEPWLESCPELFSAEELDPANDDGLWEHASVRRELNRLLALDTGAGWYRLHSFGGVQGRELVDVQLEELEASGRLRRRYFADRLRVSIGEEGVVLELENGAIVRGGEKQGFKDGVHRIFLPRASLEDWRGAALPGLSAPSAPAGETESAQAAPPAAAGERD